MNWLGLDVGGANLKLADGRGWGVSRAFALWKQPSQLPVAIAGLLAEAPAAAGLAVTMTGELADCFATKREGVSAILAAVLAASENRTVRVYLSDGSLVAAEAACQQPLRAAAANWHALAHFAGRFAPRGTALVIDIGSTTTDLVPLIDGVPVPQRWTDPERLAVGELVYTGVERSPACAVVSQVLWRGGMCPVAQELFATTLDAYLVLGELPEEPASTTTADGRPATKDAAHDRLARMICADRGMFTARDAHTAAEHIAAAQLDLLTRTAGQAVERLKTPPATVILSGVGEFLGRRLAGRVASAAQMVSLADKIGPAASRCAPAHALAVLANEELEEANG